MGMAAYGDPAQAPLDDLLTVTDGTFRVDTQRLASPWRFDVAGERRCFAPALVERLGPPRTDDGIDAPWVHVAAAAQRRLEEVVHHLCTTHLAVPLRETGALCCAGGVAQNVVLNGTLLGREDVHTLYVPPAAHDAGGALGAAMWVATERGDTVARNRQLGVESEVAPAETKARLDAHRRPTRKRRFQV